MASPWKKAKEKYSKKSTFSSPAAMAKAQREAESKSMKDLQDRREQTRQQFFKGNKNISGNRLDRRQIQSDLYEKFKQEQMKPVLTTSGKPTGAYQSVTPGGPTLADAAMQLANKYGPTPSEIFSDIGYGLGSIAKGFAEKGTPLMQLFKGIGQEVKNAWDKVRGEPTSVEGNAFPQPGSDTKELFSSIDTGIAQVDPNNMLANIARQNQYEDIPFDQLLSNATAQNLNIPKTIQEVVTDVGLSPVVTVDTPLGKVNVNRLTGDLVTGGNVGNLNYVLQGNPLSEGYGANLNYGLGQGLGIEAAMGSGMTSPDVGLGYGGALPYGNYGIGLGTNLGTGDSSLKGQLGFRPVEYLFGPTAFNPTVSLGAQMSPSQNFEPQLSLNFGYKDGGSVNKNSGLGYMFK
jgi:hypothetical protein